MSLPDILVYFELPYSLNDQDVIRLKCFILLKSTCHAFEYIKGNIIFKWLSSVVIGASVFSGSFLVSSFTCMRVCKAIGKNISITKCFTSF